MDLNEKNNNHIFLPNPESFYTLSSKLTIEDEQGLRTMKMSQWLTEDPVALHKVFQKHKFKVDGAVFDILISKLRAEHFEYFRDNLGLNMRISFKGYDKQVKAMVPYTDNPVEFYKWWCDNKDQVTMKFQEKLILFDKVFMKKPAVLKSEHRKLLNK